MSAFTLLDVKTPAYRRVQLLQQLMNQYAQNVQEGAMPGLPGGGSGSAWSTSQPVPGGPARTPTLPTLPLPRQRPLQVTLPISLSRPMPPTALPPSYSFDPMQAGPVVGPLQDGFSGGIR